MGKYYEHYKPLIDEAVANLDDEYLTDLYSILEGRLARSTAGQFSRQDYSALVKLIDQGLEKIEAIKEREEEEDMWNEDEDDEVDEKSEDDEYAEYYFTRFGDDDEDIIRKAFESGDYRIVRDNTDGVNTGNKSFETVKDDLIKSILKDALKTGKYEDVNAERSVMVQNIPQGAIEFKINIDYAYNKDDAIIDVIINLFDVEYYDDM